MTDTPESADHPTEAMPPDPALDALVRALDGASDREDGAAGATVPSDTAALDAQLHAFVRDAEDAAVVPVDVDAAWQRVRARMDAASAEPAGGASATPALTVVRGGRAGEADHGRPARAPAYEARPRWIGMAVAAAVVCFAVGLRVGERRRAARTAVPPLATVVGQRDSVRLPDGTRVLLAPGSRLEVAAGYATGDRAVTLQGTAYFAVQHDAAHPFTVHAGTAEIRDVGTAFTVRASATGRVAVAVTHGTVTLGTVAAANPVALNAGDRATLEAGTVAVRRGAVVAEDTAWTGGHLAYRDAPLEDVEADLLRWYGITLRVTDPAMRRLTVTMPPQSDAARAIQTVAAVLGATVVQRGDTVTLQPAGLRTTP